MRGKRGMILCNDKYINKKSLYTIRQSLTTRLPRMRKLIMHIRASFCYMRKENTKFIFAMKIIDNAQKCILHFIHIVHMNRVHPKMIKVRNAIMLIIVILHLIVIR